MNLGDALRSITDGTEPSADLERRAVARARQRRARRVTSVSLVLCLALGAGGIALAGRQRTVHRAAPATVPVGTDPAPVTTAQTDVSMLPAATDATTSSPPSTVALPSRAENYLIVGADNNACIDPSSPYAGAFGDRSTMGERSDTIMVLRVDPVTKRAALLSFPRDLWVDIAGRGEGRINSAYVRNDPTTLIQTLDENFGVKIDHFIQVDFCGFKTIIDSIPGGVGVPFELPARDNNTGLFVAEPGCHYFSGDEALAYVRSRHYQYFKDNQWHAEGLSDIGRIARQQDFVRRVIQTAAAKGLFDPSVLSGLIDAATTNVVTDSNLTLSTMLSLGRLLARLDAGAIGSYQIEATGKTINGAAVLIPNLSSSNMQAILAMFTGRTPLDQPPVPLSADTGGSTPVTAGTSTQPEQNTQGIVPQHDVICP